MHGGSWTIQFLGNVFVSEMRFSCLLFFILALQICASKGFASQLTDAIKFEDVRQVRALIKKGINVNEVDGKGNSPLYLSVSQLYTAKNLEKCLEITELLIESGADVNFKAGDVTSPFIQMLVTSIFVSSLVEAGGGLSKSDNQKNIRNMDVIVRILKRMIARGADVNSKIPGDMSPLLMSCVLKSDMLCRVLIENGASVNAVVKGKLTPLFAASYAGSVSNVKLLIKNGADVNLRIQADGSGKIYLGDIPLQNGDSPLSVANRNGHHEVASIIRAAGGIE